MSDQSLDDVFSGVEPTFDDPAPATPTAEVEQPVAEAEQPIEQPQSAPAAQKPPEEAETWTKAAVLDERKKRQALERQLEEMQRALSQRTQPQQPEIDPYDDPKGFVGQIEQKLAQETYKVRVEMSQEMMRQVKPDYDEKELIFVDLAKDDPTLWQKLQASPNPARFAYETAEKAERLKRIENIDAYEAQLRAEIEAKVRAELGQQQAAKEEFAGKVAQIKPSLASARSNASVSDTDYDRSLQQLFGR